MDITKVKYHNGKAEVDYSIMLAGGGTKHTQHETPDAPSSFRNALEALLGPLVPLLDLEAWKDTAKVTTVNFSRSKSGVRGVVVTLVRDNEKLPGVSVVNSPLLHEQQDASETWKLGHYDPAFTKLVNRLEQEAQKLAKAAPAQGDAFRKEPE